MKKWIAPLIAIALLSLPALAAEKKVMEKEIALNKVPKKVMAAAKKAVPGITITEAEIERGEEGRIFELEGLVDGKEYELRITPKGKVVSVEEEDDEDGEGSDGDHDDDDGHDDDDDGGHDEDDDGDHDDDDDGDHDEDDDD